VQDYGFYVTEV